MKWRLYYFYKEVEKLSSQVSFSSHKIRKTVEHGITSRCLEYYSHHMLLPVLSWCLCRLFSHEPSTHCRLHAARALQLIFLQKPAKSHAFCVKEEAIESLKKCSLFHSPEVFFPMLSSHTYLHMCVLKIKSIWVITWHSYKKCTLRKGRSRRRAVKEKTCWKQNSSVCYKATALSVRYSMDMGAAGWTLHHLSYCSTTATDLRKCCCVIQWGRNHD